jgi:ribonuclease J
MYSWINPSILIPVHGEAIHIKAHAELAKKNGIEEVLKTKNGQLIRLSNNKADIITELPTGKMAVNGDELISTDSSFFKERKKMLFNGVVTITFIFSDVGDLQELPRIKFLSVVNSVEQEELIELSEYLNDEIKSFIPFNGSKEKQLRDYLNKKIKKFIINKFDKNPSIILDIIYI